MKLLRTLSLLILPVCFFILLLCTGPRIESADHGDAPILIGTVTRDDARLTDLFAFRDNNNLVLVLCADPMVPNGLTQYTFQDDVTFEINIDNSSRVRYDDQTANGIYGGTIVEPNGINADINLKITFDSRGPNVYATGLRGNNHIVPRVFAGLRDDPFIRGPRIGKNVAAVVLEIPLAQIVQRQSDLLIWATSNVPQYQNPQADLAGRSLRSMFSENAMLNNLPPNLHWQYGFVPDVVIYDTSRPAVYPNGRGLTDDVVDLVGDTRILGNDAPCPSANDVPFLKRFPYLAAPQ